MQETLFERKNEYFIKFKGYKMEHFKNVLQRLKG